MYSLFVVDLMHEFELGVWKAIFIHILRMLDTLKKLPELDRRSVQDSCATAVNIDAPICQGSVQCQRLEMALFASSQIMFRISSNLQRETMKIFSR